MKNKLISNVVLIGLGKAEGDLLSEVREEVAPQVGIEPTTCGLTVRRSNRLSY